MCGFSGVLSNNDWSNIAEQLLSAMGDSIRHRGPNDKGIWFDEKAGIGFAHRRLSVVDLSAAGHQPMASPNGRYVIAFNGEIYNHLKLRSQLENISWRGHSDTETLLAGFDAWGIEKTIVHTTGMFAFAVWDKQNQTVTLGRDRAGEKPLYYGWQGKSFLFGSELKALKLHPEFRKELNPEALSLLLRHNYIPAPHSVYKEIYKLQPGSLLQISLKNPEPKIKSYWSATQVAMDKMSAPFKGTNSEAVDELERIAKESIAQQMIADVPLGAFLSGGIDSSTVVALMQAQSTQAVRTFTIGFHEQQYNEAQHAKEVAQHLGTEHTEMYVTTNDALEVIPKLPTLYDEPFADSSQIPTYLIAQLAQQNVSVALTGDGGDELFCGYSRYPLAEKIWGNIDKVPMPIRLLASKIIKGIPANAWSGLAAMIPRMNKTLGVKMHKGAELLSCSSVEMAYNSFIAHQNRSQNLFSAEFTQQKMGLEDKLFTGSSLTDIDRMMLMDFISYLPDDILVKVDRAAMGVSLETRVPFLDHRFIEFAWSIPLAMKRYQGGNKWLLRQLAHRYVPSELIERPKMGFAIPVHSWLTGPLKKWSEELLDESLLSNAGIFNPHEIKKIWKNYQRGQSNPSPLVWSILMFQSWWAAQ